MSGKRIIRMHDVRRIAKEKRLGPWVDLSGQLGLDRRTIASAAKGRGMASGTVKAYGRVLKCDDPDAFSHLVGQEPPAADSVPLADDEQQEITRIEAMKLIADQIRSPQVTELWASVGRADAIYEIINDIRLGEKIFLERITLRTIDPRLVTQLMEHNALGHDFAARLQANIDGIRQKLPNVIVEVQPWAGLPPFHGAHAGAVLTFGYWRITVTIPGQLEIDQTALFRGEANADDDLTDRLIQMLRGRQ